MSNILDALVYTSIKNNITDQDIIDDIKSQSQITDTNNKIISQKLTNILSNTTLKRACCSAKPPKGGNISSDNKIKVQVKLPIPDPDDPVGKKFGYTKKEIDVPVEMCKNISDGNYDPKNANKKDCDAFMNTYCNNVKYLYKLENNGTFKLKDFLKYSPECACYGDPPVGFDTTNLAKTCYMDSCSVLDISYVDELSDKACPAQVTICNAYNKTGNVNSLQGAEVNIDYKIVQECGPTQGNSGSSNQDNKIDDDKKLPYMQQELPKQDTSKQDTSKQDTSKQDTSKQDTSKQDTSKQDTSKQDTSKQDISKPDTSKQDTSKQDTSKQDTSKQDTSKQDTSKQDTSKQDTSKQDTDVSSSSQAPAKSETLSTGALIGSCICIVLCICCIIVAVVLMSRKKSAEPIS
jgi:hypothetical protein